MLVAKMFLEVWMSSGRVRGAFALVGKGILRDGKRALLASSMDLCYPCFVGSQNTPPAYMMSQSRQATRYTVCRLSSPRLLRVVRLNREAIMFNGQL